MCEWQSGEKTTFGAMLREQRWDDHRYYHHSRINQTLHLLSACTFITAFILLFTSPVVGVMAAWIIGMCSRQIGHFFFEPRGYDEVNQATDEHKEAVKVGYNIQRKVWLMSIWALSPLLLLASPSLFGIFTPHTDVASFLHNMSILWIAIGIGAALFRTIQLFFVRDVMTGLVWLTKILTDPLHDVSLYYKAPFYLLKGELVDPMADEARHAARA
jgi:hypothetical protein